MSFQIRNLSHLAYAQGFTPWHYRTADPLPEVLAPGYFRDAADFFCRGDTITVSAGRTGALLYVTEAFGPTITAAVMARTQEEPTT